MDHLDGELVRYLSFDYRNAKITVRDSTHDPGLRKRTGFFLRLLKYPDLFCLLKREGYKGERAKLLRCTNSRSAV